MPAPRAIMAAAVEGSQVDIDNALLIEARYFTSLVTGRVAKNMIQAFFFDLQSINGGGSRPAGIEKSTIKKVGVLGAGMMGAGIAYVSAKAGFDVVLKDVTIEAANKGKAYSEGIEAKALSRGKTTQEKSDALLAKITPTADPADFAGVDFVIEAVFESQELKHKVFQEIEDIVDPKALLGSNTSTLPITGLATGVKRQEDFIGIHFFSPVDKMPLVEIIRGEKTSDETLARVFDYVQAIRKTPIVVNDSRGFFTSRVIGTFINEAIGMLAEASSLPPSSRPVCRPVTRLRRFSFRMSSTSPSCRRSARNLPTPPRPKARNCRQIRPARSSTPSSRSSIVRASSVEPASTITPRASAPACGPDSARTSTPEPPTPRSRTSSTACCSSRRSRRRSASTRTS